MKANLSFRKPETNFFTSTTLTWSLVLVYPGLVSTQSHCLVTLAQLIHNICAQKAVIKKIGSVSNPSQMPKYTRRLQYTHIYYRSSQFRKHVVTNQSEAKKTLLVSTISRSYAHVWTALHALLNVKITRTAQLKWTENIITSFIKGTSLFPFTVACMWRIWHISCLNCFALIKIS